MAMPDCQIVFISEGIAIGRSDGPKVLPMDALFTDGQKLEPGAQSPRSRQVSFGAIGLLAPGTPGALPRSRQVSFGRKGANFPKWTKSPPIGHI
ncbi:hypothetical protein F2P81_026178 [Scophthalmus maximus]|uniref:Uncharacterized protein n=1 Tax=Scophthalmus maximus TaxID=52904 RepID=A0A6A4RMQ2_SCOMX|nr:hypothetical protein F2P81_026178 [Scophthalmus maximus]